MQNQNNGKFVFEDQPMSKRLFIFRNQANVETAYRFNGDDFVDDSGAPIPDCYREEILCLAFGYRPPEFGKVRRTSLCIPNYAKFVGNDHAAN